MRSRAHFLATLAAIAIVLLPACFQHSSAAGSEDTPVDVCDPPPAEFTVNLPLLHWPPDEEGQGWFRPPVWPIDAQNDSITIPNGRPIYALFVTGYESNRYLDELFFYNFARHLLAQGAYVHWAWWNNLLAPYMERPLHHPQSYPDNLDYDLPKFADSGGAAATVGIYGTGADGKALPGEDYQFLADAKLLLSAIREHNPSAMIILVGHSMGGGSIVHLASQTDVVIDILAPIDPVNNRNYPWAGLVYGGIPNTTQAWPFYNFTRWRVTRDNFLGFKGRGLACNPLGWWLKDIRLAFPLTPSWCVPWFYVHPAPTLRFGSHVINLYHRYQHEAVFPNDYEAEYWFDHSAPPGSITPGLVVPQAPVVTKGEGDADPGGWPLSDPQSDKCCATGAGVGWPSDGHGEIIGYRGPTKNYPLNPVRPVALGTRVRTSPECGSCPTPIPWPARKLYRSSSFGGEWYEEPPPPGTKSFPIQRKELLMELEGLSINDSWRHAPVNPDLCLVSSGLIDLFDRMNRPPQAYAGDDRNVECTGNGGAMVTLDGSGSIDPDGDPLTYRWALPSGFARGETAIAAVPLGSHCITLTTTDPSGHESVDVVSVTVQDTTPPDLRVTLSPAVLSPPDGSMVDVQAAVDAQDLCGGVGVSLLSITPNGSGDIAGADFGTEDYSFQLRASLSGGATRIYRVTYEATDGAGNHARTTATVTVPGP